MTAPHTDPGTGPSTGDPLADRIAAYLADQPGQRIRLEAIREHAARADPTLNGAPDARDRLDAALTRLAAAGTIILPRTTGPRAWDTRARPHLPHWVTKPPRQRPVPQIRVRVWPPALEAAGALAARPDEVALLDKIADWLRDNADAEPVPIEERSLELLDDEKALAIEVGKRLFSTGALTLDLLRCYATPLPFASQHVPGIGPTGLLVAENNATYHSLLTTIRALPADQRPDLHIAWGSGNQFPTSVRSVPLLDPPPTALYYFGDLDAAGIRLAVNAATVAASIGLPPLRPCVPLYTEVLTQGTPRADRSNRGGDLATLVAWFPEHLRPPIATLLATRQRIPQEYIGLRLLRERPDLLSALTSGGAPEVPAEGAADHADAHPAGEETA